MTGRVQSLRSNVAGNRPASGTRQPGEIFTNWPDKAFGVIDNSQTAVDLLAVRFFSTLATYHVGDQCVNAGILYRCLATTGPGAFVPGSWSALLVQSDIPIQNQRSPVGDANYAMLTNDTYVCATQALTAPRTWTLPAANAVPAGRAIWVEDTAATTTVTNTITIAPNGSDHINGAATSIILGAGARQYVVLHSDGVSNWTVANISSTIDGQPIGSRTPSTGAFTTLSTTGNATFAGTLTATGMLTANGGITSTGTINAATVQSSGASNGVVVYDRSGNSHYSIFYRTGDMTGIANSVGGANMISFDASNNATIPQTLTVTGALTTNSTLTANGAIFSNGANAIIYVQDRSSANYSYLYRSGTTVNIANNEGGGTLSVAQAALLNSNLTVNGGTAIFNNVGNTAFQVNGAASGIPAQFTGQYGCIIQVSSGVRSWYTGPWTDGFWRIYDASSGHEHVRCQFNNNMMYLGDTVSTPGDYGAWASSQVMGSTTNGLVPWVFAGITNISGYIDYVARVETTAANLMWMGYGTTNVGTITTNGGQCFYNSACDGRLKDNVRPLIAEIDVGDIIDAIKPVRFEWNTTPDHPTDVGFVAQELHAVVPNVVTPGAPAPMPDSLMRANGKQIDGMIADEPVGETIGETVWSADTSKLIPYMIAELQALRQRVKQLEGR